MEDLIQTPLSFNEMGMTFNPTEILKMSEGVAVYKLGADSQLFVEFYERRKAVPFKSSEAAVHFELVDYVKIERPGDKCAVDRKARDEDKRRFPEQWYRYKQGKSQFLGTRIEVLAQQGLLSDGQIEMLKFAKILSVEQGANASELVINGLGTEGAYIQKICKGFLNYKAQVEGKADVDKLKSDLQAERAELRLEIDKLKASQEVLEAKQREQLQAEVRLEKRKEGVENATKRRIRAPKVEESSDDLTDEPSLVA